ncbi:hypothetical protein D3C78_1780820 [compost metagenome]
MVHPPAQFDLAEQGRPLRFVGPDAELVHGTPDHFVNAVARQAAEAVVDFQVQAAGAHGYGDGVGAGVKRLGEFLFTGLDCRFGALLLSDVTQ